jgi:ribosome-associated translation inhibitor RaiA
MPDRFTIRGVSSDALRTHMIERLTFALNQHEKDVTRVDVNLTDENGPKGGSDDKRLNVVIHLRGGADVIVDERGADAYAVASTAADRIKQAVGRKLDRKRDNHHGAASAPHHGMEGVEST